MLYYHKKCNSIGGDGAVTVAMISFFDSPATI